MCAVASLLLMHLLVGSPRRILLELLNQIGGHKREFSLTDITIQRPFKAEHVPPTLLFVISLAVPLGCVVVLGAGLYRSRWDVHNAVLGEFWLRNQGWDMGVVVEAERVQRGRARGSYERRRMRKRTTP